MKPASTDAELAVVVSNTDAPVDQHGFMQAAQRYVEALPTREQAPVILGLAFNSLLNVLPLAVFILKIQEEMKVESMVAPAVAMMAMFPLEYFSEWFHYGERLKGEPEIKLEGQQASALLILMILVPALINSFVKGALTAMAGYEGNVLAQVGLAFFLGAMNMINTLLSGVIPIWKTLAAKYDLAPIDQQWLFKNIYTPDSFRFLSEVYANLAPGVMGGMYGVFTDETVKQHVPGIGGEIFAVVGGTAALLAGAVVTTYFDVELLRQQNVAMAQAARNHAGDADLNAVADGAYNSMDEAQTSVCGKASQVIQILTGVDHSQLPKEFTGQSYLSASRYTVVQCLNELLTGHSLNDSMQALAKRSNVDINSSLSAANLVVYGGGLYCLVNKAFDEYVVSSDGQATLGKHMFGVDQTAALSHSPYVIASIQVISAFAAFAAAYPKRQLVGEGVVKRAAVEGSTTTMHSINPVVQTSTVDNPMNTKVVVTKYEV